MSGLARGYVAHLAVDNTVARLVEAFGVEGATKATRGQIEAAAEAVIKRMTNGGQPERRLVAALADETTDHMKGAQHGRS